jgi:hypothetical protein
MSASSFASPAFISAIICSCIFIMSAMLGCCGTPNVIAQSDERGCSE